INLVVERAVILDGQIGLHVDDVVEGKPSRLENSAQVLDRAAHFFFERARDDDAGFAVDRGLAGNEHQVAGNESRAEGQVRASALVDELEHQYVLWSGNKVGRKNMDLGRPREVFQLLVEKGQDPLDPVAARHNEAGAA